MVHPHALIIEDHTDSIEVLGRMLSGAGITYTAFNRPAQLSQLSPEDMDKVSMVFLDLDMPEMNGYEVFRMLRQQYGLQAPIIAYTVNTNERASTRSMGFNGMLPKPLDPTCFQEQLRRILAGEAVWDEC